MNSVSYAAFKSDIESTFQSVITKHEPVVVRKDRRSSVVMLPLDEYESLMETRYLLASTANSERLMKGIDEVEALIAQSVK
jgi:antitoxin YefM